MMEVFYTQPNLSEILEIEVPNQRFLSQLYDKTGKTHTEFNEMLAQFRDIVSSTKEIVIKDIIGGLGDDILLTRIALLLAKKTKKEIYCQISDPLFSFLSNKDIHPLLHFEKRSPQVSAQNLKSNALYIHDAYGIRFTQDNANIDSFAALESSPPQGIGEKSFQVGILFYVLGHEITKVDICSQSILEFIQPSELTAEQNLDILLIPDAKEYDTPDGTRSTKSLTLEEWEIYFQKLEKKYGDGLQEKLRMGIVMGISHPDYCNNVINLAKRNGFAPEIIEGDLMDLVLAMWRAKTIVGMDSGTSHLALDVVRLASKYGRNIKIKSVYNISVFDLEVYGIEGAETFSFLNSRGQFTSERIADFLIS